jgi:hypothetical protein
MCSPDPRTCSLKERQQFARWMVAVIGAFAVTMAVALAVTVVVTTRGLWN